MNLKNLSQRAVLLGSVAAVGTSCARPVGDICRLRAHNLRKDLACLERQDPLPCKPLTLSDVITIGLSRNMDLVVQEYQIKVQRSVSLVAQMQQLPRYTISGEGSWRDKPNASLYRNLTTGETTAGTVSSEQTTNRWEFRDTFNLLDFGLGYFRARQELDRTLLVAQQTVKARQNLILDLTKSYWRVIVAQKNQIGATQLLEDIKATQEALRRQTPNQTLPEVTRLSYEKQLLDMQRRMGIIQYELQAAKAELAGLMGTPFCTDFELEDVEFQEAEDLGCDVCQMEDMALRTRPELFVHDLEEHIYADEVRASMLQMFPNVALFHSWTSDKNTFLLFHSWNTMGFTAAWELLNIPQHIYQAQAAKYHEITISNQRLASSIAVISQVNISYITYMQKQEQFRLAQETVKVQDSLRNAAEKEYTLGNLGGNEYLDIQYDTAVARIDAWTAYADLQLATEQLNNSIGQPLRFGHVSEDSLFQDFDDEPICCHEAAPAVSTPPEASTTPYEMPAQPVVEPATEAEGMPEPELQEMPGLQPAVEPATETLQMPAMPGETPVEVTPQAVEPEKPLPREEPPSGESNEPTGAELQDGSEGTTVMPQGDEETPSEQPASDDTSFESDSGTFFYRLSTPQGDQVWPVPMPTQNAATPIR